MNRIGIMSAPHAMGIAAAVADVFGAAMFCIAVPGYDFVSFLKVAIVGGLPVAFALGGLIGPQIARPLIGTRLVAWTNAVATGALTAFAPAAACMLIETPFSIYEGNHLPLDQWLTVLAMLAVAGAVGGLLFRLLYGPRRLPEKIR